MADTESLFHACKAGKLDEVVKLITNKWFFSAISSKRVNATDMNLDTPLHVVALNGHKDIAQFIVGFANVNAKNKNHYTPLHYAAQNGYIDIVDLLISEGALVNNAISFNTKTDAWVYSPLHLAVLNGHKDVVELLVAKRADVNDHLNARRYSPLHLAVRKRYESIVSLLISHGAEVDAEDHEKYTPLTHAIAMGQESIQQVLIANHAKLGTERRIHYKHDVSLVDLVLGTRDCYEKSDRMKGIICYSCGAAFTGWRSGVMSGDVLMSMLDGTSYTCKSCGVNFCMDCMTFLKNQPCTQCNKPHGW